MKLVHGHWFLLLSRSRSRFADLYRTQHVRNATSTAIAYRRHTANAQHLLLADHHSLIGGLVVVVIAADVALLLLPAAGVVVARHRRILLACQIGTATDAVVAELRLHGGRVLLVALLAFFATITTALDRPIYERMRFTGGAVRRPEQLHEHLGGLMQRLAATVGGCVQHNAHLLMHVGRLHVGERRPDDSALTSVDVGGVRDICGCGGGCIIVRLGQFDKAHGNVLLGHLVAQDDQLLAAGARTAQVADIGHDQVNVGFLVEDGVGEKRRQGDEVQPAGVWIGAVDEYLEADAEGVQVDVARLLQVVVEATCERNWCNLWGMR